MEHEKSKSHFLNFVSKTLSGPEYFLLSFTHLDRIFLWLYKNVFLIYPVATSLEKQVQWAFTVPTFRGLGNFQDYSWMQPQCVFCGLQYKIMMLVFCWEENILGLFLAATEGLGYSREQEGEVKFYKFLEPCNLTEPAVLVRAVKLKILSLWWTSWVEFVTKLHS